MGDPLCRVVDDNGQVVGGDPVVALEYYVVDAPLVGARHEVGEAETFAVGQQAQGGSPAGIDQTAAVLSGKGAAGTRVGAVG